MIGHDDEGECFGLLEMLGIFKYVDQFSCSAEVAKNWQTVVSWGGDEVNAVGFRVPSMA